VRCLVRRCPGALRWNGHASRPAPPLFIGVRSDPFFADRKVSCTGWSAARQGVFGLDRDRTFGEANILSLAWKSLTTCSAAGPSAEQGIRGSLRRDGTRVQMTGGDTRRQPRPSTPTRSRTSSTPPTDRYVQNQLKPRSGNAERPTATRDDRPRRRPSPCFPTSALRPHHAGPLPNGGMTDDVFSTPHAVLTHGAADPHKQSNRTTI